MTEKTEKFDEVPLTEPTVIRIDEEEVVVALQPREESYGSDSVCIEIPEAIQTTNVPAVTNNSPTETSQLAECNICENRRFQNPEAAPHDKRILKPCFCNFRVHHGCLAEILQNQKKCQLCGVKYRYYKYGSCCDFIRRYKIQFGFVTLISVALIVIGLYGLYHGFPILGSARFFLMVFAVFILSVGCIIGSVYCSTMFRQRYPRFKKRYGNITIFDYKPEANKSRKPKLSEFKTLYGRNDNTVAFNVTAGQYLLGHKKTFSENQASTPLETAERPVKFSFDTPDNM